MIEIDKVFIPHKPTAPTNNPIEPLPEKETLVWDKGDLLGTSPQTPSTVLLHDPIEAEQRGFDWIELMQVANTGQFAKGFRWWKVEKTPKPVKEETDTWTFKGEKGLVQFNLGNACDIQTKHFIA